MRAIVVTDRNSLELLDVPDPVPAPGEVVVRVTAAGVNRADLLQRAGHYPPPPGASEILGLEVSGTITAMADDVAGWSAGDRVCALLAGGGYAEQVAVPAGQLLPVRAGQDLADAAGLPEAVCTAWSNLVGTASLRPEETVLIHGGSGGVGSIAIQLAAAIGARVLTTAGSAERAARCRELGADVAIGYRNEDVAAAVGEATEGRGVDVILDVLGAGGFEQNLRCLAAGGRLVIIGMQQGTRAELDIGRLLVKRASIHGTTLRSRSLQEKAAIVAEVRRHAWPMLEDGRLRAVIHRRLPLADAELAHTLMDSGEVFGKLLLIP